MKNCINRLLSSGLIDQYRADQARALFDENLDQARLGLGGEEAIARAREETIAELRRGLAQLKREKLLQASRAKAILEQTRASGVPVDRAMQAVIGADTGVSGITSVETRYKSLRGWFHKDMTNFLAKFRRDLLGRTRSLADLQDVVREVFGQATGNAAAREMAQAWSQTAEKARRMFNQAGGDIPRLDDWGMPQRHDAVAVRAAGFDDWYGFIRPRIDIEKMIDYRTGRPMGEDRFRLAAEEAYRNIATEGWAGREPSGGAYGKKLSRRHMDHRFFKFASPDAWMEYQQRFGEGDIFSTMMAHLDGMARDIASLQVLGPNPTSTIRWMGAVVEKDLRMEALRSRASTDSVDSKIRSAKRQMDLLYEQHTGSSNSPIHGKAARTMAGTRSLLQSAQLGAAALSAVSDISFQAMAASRIGIPYTRVARRFASMLNPMNIEDQKIAVRMGFIADNWATLASAQQRYLGEVSGPEITRRIADTVMRVSGLSPWTQAGRWAFGMEFTGFLGDHVSRGFTDLPQPLRRTMETYGITSADWEMARKAPLYNHEGASFLRPEDMGDETVALKFLDMIHGETEFAVPSTSARGRVALTGEVRPGTIQGELIRSVSMYKNFPVTLMMTHFRRAMSLPTAAERGKYFAQLILMSTALGALSMQLKEISKGRDPRKMIDWNDPAAMAKFWSAAMLQGGGIGIFGDFLFAQENRFGGGLAQTVAGPMVGLAADFTGYFNQNVGAMIDGRDTAWAGGAIDLAQRYMPGGSLWYARLGMESLLWNQLREFADPRYNDRIKRMVRNARRDYGQEYWFRPGEVLPDRAPNLAAAFGG